MYPEETALKNEVERCVNQNIWLTRKPNVKIKRNWPVPKGNFVTSLIEKSLIQVQNRSKNMMYETKNMSKYGDTLVQISERLCPNIRKVVSKNPKGCVQKSERLCPNIRKVVSKYPKGSGKFQKFQLKLFQSSACPGWLVLRVWRLVLSGLSAFSGSYNLIRGEIW